MERHQELIGGELIEKAVPAGEHGGAQFAVACNIYAPFKAPVAEGAWWLVVRVRGGGQARDGKIVRPDLLG